MNYSLDNIPNSGKNPVVWMDIIIKEEVIGRIYIRLFSDIFPAGVENFIGLVEGKTVKTEHKGKGKFAYRKETIRSYFGCKFFNNSHNNYIVSGDIYSNDSTKAGTIYNDEPIPAVFGDHFYEHNLKGLVSLVPFRDEETGELFYDSTFLITLDKAKKTNMLSELNANQVVIGQIYQGLDVLDHINKLIFPFAGRKYPEITIGKCGVNRTGIMERNYRLPGM